MTLAVARRGPRPPGRSVTRLVSLELRRSTMVWMLPVVAGLFWYNAFRESMALPPLWNLRAMAMQQSILLDFVPPVVGAAAWLGSREGRHRMGDLIAGTPRSGWTRRLVAWAACTCWAEAAYLGCVGVLYGVTAGQAPWGGPLWWPAAVGAVGIPAISALGFVVGVFLPHRFTVPLTILAVFFGLGFGLYPIHTTPSYWQVDPLWAPPNASVATFYPYRPDLPIAQVIFLIGLTAALLGVVGLPGAGRWPRRVAVCLGAVGIASAATSVLLVGTSRPDGHGMTLIPALHDSADDRPVPYTPVCGRTAIRVCVHPAHAAYLPVVTDALGPVLSELAGVPGAPLTVEETAPVFRQRGDDVVVGGGGPRTVGGRPEIGLVVPDTLPGEYGMTTAEFTRAVASSAGLDLISTVVGRTPHPGPAQRAVTMALLTVAGIDGGRMAARPAENGLPSPGSPEFDAARRFAALPFSTRHAWLVAHAAALRAGRLTLRDLP
ncbi:hypothetical protein [Actinoallomurus soli]|uniref:hypothetical protein n=1 Tax=Actinoallomurus soli TaxID=2952535 RepID=UPI0020937880|nr:hypothetical protein [Actinoallomurus soli]MCO5970146.1 hypothetical protein [Actinoallomurus soli]